MQDWLGQSAAELGRGIADGSIDPVALTQTYLDAIDAHPFRDRIYARVTADRALAEAEAAAARAKSGARLSPLDGVPISWKDLFDTAGVATEAGSALLKDRVPDRDAPVLLNATANGLVCLGKTHMSELAFSGLGLNPVTATPPCVNDHDAVSGGSSSGAATSVAFGLAACGIGSDTGGSVRIPSAWNDLVGLKTTSGRISLRGVVPLCEKFDTVGPLCRTVEDAALMLALLEGGKPADLRGVEVKGKRFAVLQTAVMEPCRKEPLQAFDDAVAKLAEAGAEITRIDAPEVAQAMDLAGILFTTEAYGTWREVIEANPDLMFDRILDRFRSGAHHLGADYVAAWQELEGYRNRWYARVAGYDAVLCPAAPNLPPQHDRLMSDSDYYVTENLLTLNNTRVGNLMGNCGVTLPTGVPSCGILFNGLPFQEERLLRIAAAAESVLTAT
ncbi:Mandelamide hydrolase [Thalassovita gelatinovora]|uniref:Mandelamide hydrolase n=1 Tax=Thalassovita gelatinovora TaxID=53501 RepID=A0A0P1F665_THAGE|nr:amidase family protein [Thalassovita gelatinovora]QIZ80890.1 amidase [Thalassovita gelatinovora]CUH63360.1 Mandelamide hydrolase [Thalassovita gelatinovora]SEQ65755.1 aspartyl-tRNA(Asn)/glutamyl-tRNA(Gln) amidotransferase subunit A [Thalassovita gelatinovora]